MRNCVLFDFDGTITSKDTTKFLIIDLIRIRPLRVIGIIRFIIIIIFSKNADQIQLYKNKAVGYLINGVSKPEISNNLSNFKLRVEGLFRQQILEEIKKHHKDGSKILIVTASPAFAISCCLSKLPVTVIGTNFKDYNGIYTGEVMNPICYGKLKVKCIESWTKENKLIFTYIEAWSDNFSDYPMLKMAKNRYWIGDKSLKRIVDIKDPIGTFIFNDL